MEDNWEPDGWEPDEPPFKLGEIPMMLTQPRDIARYFCGLTSPKLTGLKLTRDREFGSLGHISFGRVLEKVKGP